MRIYKHILFIVSIGCIGNAVLASDWRDIIPLRATRADVEKKLGVTPSGRSHDHFKIDGYDVFIRYTTKRCEGNTPGDWNVPIGTVYLIDVLPTTRVSLSTLIVNLKEFKIAEVKDVAGAKIYTDAESGFEFEYYETKDAIVRLSYFPSNKDSHLRCPGQTK